MGQKCDLNSKIPAPQAQVLVQTPVSPTHTQKTANAKKKKPKITNVRNATGESLQIL
jgi:hypothetical protein